jgi:hypothetical protein
MLRFTGANVRTRVYTPWKPLRRAPAPPEVESMRTRTIAGLVCSLLAVTAVVGPPAAGARTRAAVRAARVYRLGDRVLAIGMNGVDVFHLQVLLTRRGFHVTADRAFGPQTRAAVIRAQRAYGLIPDGVVGWMTLTALRTGSVPACPSTPGPGDAVTRWLPVVTCVLGLVHEPASMAPDVLLVIAHESGGNPNAINKWDINARRGDPSRGLMQVIGAVFSRYRNHAMSSNIYDPAANIYAGVAYAIAVYGSVSKIPGVKSVAAGRGYVPYKMRG